MIDKPVTFIPAEEFIISDLETLKVLADPLRLSIVEYLSKPGTVKQIAKKIGKPPTKLYYHFNLLEKHNLIQMVDTRIVSGIVEKHYQAAAKVYRLEQDLLSPSGEGFDEKLSVIMSGTLGDIRGDLRESILAGVADVSETAQPHRRVMMTQGRLLLSPEQARNFYTRMMDLLKEFDSLQDDYAPNEDAIPYKLALLIHPISRSADDEEAE